jgi:hypothetical protein
MKATDAQITERIPVWKVLSEFFLDTELQPSDYEHIAKVLAGSRFSEEEIEEILVGEVCPVCRGNALSSAGEWVGFDTDWLKDNCAKHIGRRPLSKKLSSLLNGWMYSNHWNQVRIRLSELRATI